MRPLTERKVIFSVYRTEHSFEVNGQRHRQAVSMLENAGISLAELWGKWEGKDEQAIAAWIKKASDLEYLTMVAKSFDQEMVCLVEPDTSAYALDMKDGTSTFKGYWKPVKPWQEESWLATNPEGYTHDEQTGVYWVVGS